MALFSSYSNSVFVVSTTTNLWKAISFSQNELLKYERAARPPNEQLIQGEYDINHPLNGFRWEKNIQDTNPLPNIRVRQINFQLFWKERNNEYSYTSDIYIKPK